MDTVQKTGSLAVGAMIAAVVSFFSTFAGHPMIGVLCGVISIPLGIIGLLSAASPRVGGGILSIGAIVLGVIAIGIAVLGGIGKLVF